MGNCPLITIGITCFNAEDTILRAIWSAQKQHYPNFEIVVVDDTSTDKSTSIIEKIQKVDWRISLHRHDENRGVAAARNSIIRHAKGEYVAFFDDDDESLPGRLSKQYERLSKFQEKNPGVPALCYSNLNFIQNGKTSKTVLKGVGYQSPEPHGTMVLEFFLLNNKKAKYCWGIFGTCALFASRDVLRKFGFDSRFRRSEDAELAARIAMEGGYFVSVDEPLVTQYETKASDKTDKKCLIYDLMLWRKHKNNIPKTINYYGAACLRHSWLCNIKNQRWRRLTALLPAQMLLPKKHLMKAVSRRVREYGWKVLTGL